MNKCRCLFAAVLVFSRFFWLDELKTKRMWRQETPTPVRAKVFRKDGALRPGLRLLARNNVRSNTV
jgi:hypothetical protein